MFEATTVVAVKEGDQVAIAGDGQVTMQHTVMKHKAKKIRRLYNDQIVAGFAGSAADGFTLFEKFEAKIEEFHGKKARSVIDCSKSRTFIGNFR